MATAPLIDYLNGSGSTQNLTVTTNLAGLAFTGRLDPNTVDVQVSINGAGFVSDPTLVGLTLPTFAVPNPASFPSGLTLEKGQNFIQLRAIDVFGSVSPVSTISVTVVADVDVGVIQAPPTGIQIVRHASDIELRWYDPFSDSTPSPVGPVAPASPIGYNVYASTGAGGTASGYQKINRDLIPASTPPKSVVQESIMFDESFDLVDTDGNNLVIVSRTTDPASGATVAQTTETSFPLVLTKNFRLRTVVSDIRVQKFYSFHHDRSAGIASGVLNNDLFGAVSPSDPLFYVVTAVYFDSITGQMMESRYSSEISGLPLPLDTTVRGIRIRDRRTVAQDYITEVSQTEPTLSLIPGSTIREVHIEPFSNEIQKAYFLLDFVHRSKSFAALLQIDDPTFSGTPVPVSQSPYKQNLATALGLTSDASTQALINGAFDSLAKNFGRTRTGLRSATVVQTFYTKTRPTRDLVVSQNALVRSSTNSKAPRFRSRGLVRLTAADAQKYYNPDKQRYEITVSMVAETPGSAGNVPAGTLDTVVSGATGLQTENTEASDFGEDVQSNLSLAEECIRSLIALDTGTAGGYEDTAIGTPGLLEAKVVKAGDDLMMRDYDPVRQKHVGGKVDMYVKGTIERTVTEKFAFQFQEARNVRFDVIDATNLIFRARDSRLASDNPIQEMLYNPSQGFGLRNHSDFPTASYDLTGAVILDYQTIQLNAALPQPPTKLDDFIEGDYRYRSNNRFTAGVQPVLRISSVVGEVSGTLDPVLGYTLYKLEDPLLYGESTKANDYVSINQVGSVPNGQPVPVNNEQHVLIGAFQEPLGAVGINVYTIAVYSADRLTRYNGPDSPDPDYLIVGGSQTTPVKIIRATASNIPSGSTVSVDYEHDENFTVTYVVNDVLQQLQSRIEKSRHVTADVLVKQAVENPMSTEATVQLAPNAVQSVVDDSIRTAFTVLTDSKGIGKSVYQSQVSNKIGDTSGVNFVVQPFPKMTLRDGALRIREFVANNYQPLPSLSRYSNAVFILEQALPFNTIDGGGGASQHHGVFMDGLQMNMSPSLDQVGELPGQSWIIGSSGAVITGYSDDATLKPLFPVAADLAAERLRRTANRVVVSLNAGIIPPDVPLNHSFAATYVVFGDKGTKDISVTPIEYLTPGDLTLTYRSA